MGIINISLFGLVHNVDAKFLVAHDVGQFVPLVQPQNLFVRFHANSFCVFPNYISCEF